MLWVQMITARESFRSDQLFYHAGRLGRIKQKFGITCERASAFWIKKLLLFFAQKKKCTPLTVFFLQNLFNMPSLNSQSGVFVIALAQIEVIYASLWNNQSCLSRALEAPGSESFSNEFWFAKSQSNKLLLLCTNIKTNAPFLCHQLLVLGEESKKRKG